MNENNKVTVLLSLVRKAWMGDRDAVDKLSSIVGIPSPRIIPYSIDKESRGIAQEYLKLTSSMLDDQLRQDKHLQQHTKRLRPRTAHAVVNSKHGNRNITKKTPGSTLKAPHNSRLLTTPVTPDRHTKCTQSTLHQHNGLSNGLQLDLQHGSDNLPMSDLNDLIPLFKSQSSCLQQSLSSMERLHETDGRQLPNENANADLFSMSGLLISKKTRPVSAALQRRQDYLRTQTRTRPSTAKSPFVAVSDADYQDIIIKSAEITPRGGEEEPDEPIPIHVNIFDNRPPRVQSAVEPRDHFALGDVSDALHHVQEMERIFRQNTKRLQQKIGVSPQGLI